MFFALSLCGFYANSMIFIQNFVRSLFLQVLLYGLMPWFIYGFPSFGSYVQLFAKRLFSELLKSFLWFLLILIPFLVPFEYKKLSFLCLYAVFNDFSMSFSLSWSSQELQELFFAAINLCSYLPLFSIFGLWTI